MSSNDGSSTTSLEEIAELPFEAAFERLESVVARLESGDLPLEFSIELYEEGAALATRCSDLLEVAELRVRAVDEEGREAGEVRL